jgi:bacillolysin
LSRTSALVRVSALSTIAVGMACAVLPVASAGASGSTHSVRAQLLDRAGGHGTFRSAAGTAGAFFGTSPGHAAIRPAGISAHDEPAAAATGWMRRYGAAFGVRDAAHNLRTERVQQTKAGPVVRVQQTVSGLPVVGGELSLLLDGSNDLVSVIGHVSSAESADTTPVVTAGMAKKLAIRAVAKQRPGARHAPKLTATKPVLSLLDQKVLGGPVVTAPMSAWVTTVTTADHVIRHHVYVDATHGSIALDLNDNPQATRTVCQPAGYNGSLKSEKIADPTCTGPDTEIVSSPGSSKDTDVFDAYLFAGNVDDFYSTLLGRNSLDGKGMDLNSTAHFCDINDPFPGDCPLPNAFWDGHEMVYGDGYSRGLDVVGHEMTHGVTEHTSNLISYYQSGAINESQSDVMGELIQQIEGSQENTPSDTVYDPAQPWVIGEQLPDGPFRHMDHPESDTTLDSNNNVVPAPDPDSMTSVNYDGQPFWVDNGGVHENALVGDKAAFLIAAGADGHGGGTFNTFTIRGVAGDGSANDPNSTGLTEDTVVKDVKTANIYYQLDKMMVSATTYADLYKLLPQACDALVGKSLPMPSAWTTNPTSITSTDCDQVRLAVKATKMNVLPTKSGAGVPTPSPFCTNGGSATGRRTDSFETNPFSAGSYTRSHSTRQVADPYGGNFTSGEYGSWGWTRQFQQSVSHASLWGADVDPFAASPDPNLPAYAYEDTRVQKVSAVHPAVGTYVRFRTAWNFESSPASANDLNTLYNFDGGVVEYSVDKGKSWHDAGSLFVNNGYNGHIDKTDGLFGSGYVDPNPLKGHRAFVRDSRGWTASRMDLSSLHGKAVLLRWRVGADDQGSALGWFVDDVTSYSCNPTHVSIGAPAKVIAGHAVTVSGHLVRAGTSTALRGLPVILWEKRHSSSRWIRVSTHTTNRYGNVHWSRTHSVAYDYRVKMPGKTPFAPSNYAATTVRLR